MKTDINATMDPPAIDENSQELNFRKNIYEFLRDIYYREIDSDKARLLLTGGVLEYFNRSGYEFDLSFFEGFDKERETELAVEYTRIFIGPGDHLSPYESIHNKNDKDCGRLWGETTCHVKKYMEHFGLSFDGPEYHGIPDHIGTECEFMALLLDAQIKALNENDSEKSGKLFAIQKDFFAEHLSQWAPVFADKLQKVARHNFYKEIAKLTADFVQSETEIYL